ncbi:MAG: 4Fe-4S dicluster domain-containing protein [Coriobacteriia bacterium]|nr:4Fe-4S dicluster domain-containing protein [Coriobacteriia bacterium]
MTETLNLKAKLGLDVFKEGGPFHIQINAGKQDDPRLLTCVRLCPAGLYSLDEQGVISLSQDGCLECGTCKIICGDELLTWAYPEGASGVQYRFG